MKTAVYISLFTLFVLFACGDEDIKSQWTSSNLVIDGSTMDWQDMQVTYNEDLKVAFGIANDDSSFYLMIRFKDRRMAQMMAMRGFKLWFNNGESSDPNFGVRYMLPLSERPQRKKGQMDEEKINEENKNQMRFPGQHFSLVKSGDKNIDWSLITFPQIKAAFAFLNGDYSLEYKIPRRGGEYLPFDFDITGNNDFEVGIVLEAMKRPEGGHGGRGGEGGMGGRGGDGMRGGGVRGHGDGFPGGERPEMGEKSLWLNIEIAHNPG
jgi:hypothetical protein